MGSEFRSFDEFWPFYLGEHSHPTNRVLHFVGTTLAMLFAIGTIVTLQPWFLPLALLPGYGMAWIGHFVIEKNRPATFKHPLWSLMGDFKMWFYFATGRLDAELARVGAAKAGA